MALFSEQDLPAAMQFLHWGQFLEAVPRLEVFPAAKRPLAMFRQVVFPLARLGPPFLPGMCPAERHSSCLVEVVDL